MKLLSPFKVKRNLCYAHYFLHVSVDDLTSTVKSKSAVNLSNLYFFKFVLFVN